LDGGVGGAEATLGYDGGMPRLACWSCGRQLYTVSPLESLFSEERRCPRCGAFLNNERRETDRRWFVRRQNPTDDPGPPDGVERRIDDRRGIRRRRPVDGTDR
jgi:ribosomal protein S27AE